MSEGIDMPWVVGIDEAGYGPNLGPLVQAAVALRLPEGDVAGWETLRPWVRRCHERDDGRLLIDDSKKVYAGANGFARLQRVTRLFLGAHPKEWTSAPPLSGAIDNLFILTPDEFRAELYREPWFDHAEAIPAEALNDGRDGDHFFAVVNCSGGSFFACPLVIPTPRFNRRIDDAGSKAAILTDGLIHILRETFTAGRAGYDNGANEPLLIVCDKQGGRNFYAPFLQDAFPDGWVVAERESAAESRYRVLGLGREVTVVFRPKADGDSVCVALASMVCKYLREVCMMQFNAFWQRHVPGLKPTAGYPGDAKRFYSEIQPAMARLGIHPDAVWRKK